MKINNITKRSVEDALRKIYEVRQIVKAPLQFEKRRKKLFMPDLAKDLQIAVERIEAVENQLIFILQSTYKPLLDEPKDLIKTGDVAMYGGAKVTVTKYGTHNSEISMEVNGLTVSKKVLTELLYKQE
jgi:hypothetical protein